MKASSKKSRVNEQIIAEKIRLIDSEGEQLGVVTLQEALDKAEQLSLDLVEISPNADPIVCKIMDYGRFRFSQNKKRLGNKKKQRKTQLKEIKFRPTTDVGDYNVKLKKIIAFLDSGDKVKVTIRFRGREVVHQSVALDLVKKVEGDVQQHATVEFNPRLEGRQMTMMLSPIKKI